VNVTQFDSIAHAVATIEAWRMDYYENRPLGSLGHLTPWECASQRQVTRTAESAFLSL
jgi:transposase InsO family protein